MKKLLTLLALPLLALASFTVAPSGASIDSAASIDSVESVATVERPMHLQDSLSLFTCAVNRPDPAGPLDFRNGTVNHSHENVDKRVTDPLGGTQITWYDCEVYNNPGLDGCNYAALYVNANRNDTSTDYGIVTPALNANCFS